MVQFRKWLLRETNDREFMATMGFGKHKGKHHTQVPGGYLRWALDNTQQFNPQDRAEIEDYLNKRGAQPAEPVTPTPAMPGQPVAPQVPAGQPRSDQEFIAQGYRKITAQFDNPAKGIKIGDPIWYRGKQPGEKYASVFPVGQGAAPAQTPQAPAAPTPVPSTGEWYCAYVANTQDKVVLKPQDPKNLRGPWDYLEVDPSDGELIGGEIPYESLADFVRSANDETGGKKRVAQPEDWLKQAAAPAPTPTPAPAPNGGDENGNGNGNGPGMMTRPMPEQVRIPEQNMTEYNKAIEAKFVNTSENVMIDALAGTGKTTMLKHLSSYIKPGEKWLYLVFNKKNQLESQSAFPDGVDVLTTHAFLGRILKQSGKEVGGDTELPPRGQKWKKIYQVADQMIPLDWPESIHSYMDRRSREMVSPFHWKGKRVVTKVASLAKAYALNPNDPAIADQLMELIAKQSIDTDLSSEKREQDRDFTPDIVEMAVQLMQYTLPGGLPRHMDQQFSMYRDQDDTLWYAALYADGINWRTGYNVILMDEVQDFNMCQLVMAQKLREAGSRVVGVGDPNQAMYLFRGADSAAFEKLKETIGGGDSMSLPINFRSGGNIINWVTNNTHVKNLQAAPHLAGKGSVYAIGGTHPPKGYEEFMGQLMEEWGASAAQGRGATTEATSIICRTNAPLGHAALSLLKNGIDFQIVGVDLYEGLEELIKKVTYNKPQDANIYQFAGVLGNYVDKLANKWANKISKQDELEEMEGYADVLYSVLQHLEENDFREDERSPQLRTAKDLIIYLRHKLGGVDPESAQEMAAFKAKDPKSFVTLTTAHKAKGLEWERVFLLKPGEYDPKGKKIRNEEQAQQELNAWYVAATRGRNTLMVSADDEP